MSTSFVNFYFEWLRLDYYSSTFHFKYNRRKYSIAILPAACIIREIKYIYRGKNTVLK